MARTPAVLTATLVALVLGSGAAYADPGDVRWRYVPEGAGRANDVLTGPNRTVYVTGTLDNGSGGGGFYTAALTPEGTVRWSASVDATQPGSTDGAVAAALDPERGRLYVTGVVANGADSDVRTIAYDPATGSELWRASYASPPNPAGNDDAAHGLVVDLGNGQVVVAGTTQGPGATQDHLLVAYDTSGQQRWVRRSGTAGSFDDGWTGIGRDGLGNVYLLGVSRDPTRAFATVASYTRDGAARWSARVAEAAIVYGDTVLVDEVRRQVVVPVATYPDFTGTPGQVAVRLWDLDGVPRWTRTFADYGYATPKAVLGDSGRITVTHQISDGLLTGTRLTELSSGGGRRWAQDILREQGFSPADLVFSANDGVVFVTGLGGNSQETLGYATRGFPGAPQYFSRLNRNDRAQPDASSLTVDQPNGQPYLAGRFVRARGDGFALLALER